jgi:phage repressor protein C with HTH and peptisase S24 domain
MGTTLGEALKSARQRMGKTQKDVADAVGGISSAAVGQWESGKTEPSTANLVKACEFLGITIADATSGRTGPAPDLVAPRPPASQDYALAPDADTLRLGAKDVPVIGSTVGGSSGEFYMNGEVVDYVRRLPGIATNKNVFGIYVSSDSMWPRFKPGELVYVSPGRPPAPGDDVIIELTNPEGERNGNSYIKTLKRRTGDRIICEQYNPPGEVEYDRREVKAIYRIIPLSELAGF